MLNSYRPIATKATQKTFFDYIDCLDVPQIDYFAIGVQNRANKTSISLMSRPEWQKIFSENDFANNDPIRKASLLTSRKVISLNEIDYSDSLGKEIMRQRALYEIKNGIIFMDRFENHNYILTLGTNFSKFDAYDFLIRYHDRINRLKTDLIKIIAREAKEFLF